MNRLFAFTCLAAGSLMIGCSDGLKEFPCAAVSGIVTCEGQPVAEAQVFFAPKMTGKTAEVGKPGFSWTAEDGRFMLSTYGDEDGAVVGTHVVRVTTGSKYPCNCVGDETRDLMEVEIKADTENEFEIKLPKRTAPAQKNPFDDAEPDEKK